MVTLPVIEFLPATTMSEGMKEQLMLEMSAAEAMGKSGSDKANYITDKMREKHGGYWAAVAVRISESYLYIRPVAGHLALFDYDGLRWHVYKPEDCQKVHLGDPDNSVSRYPLPQVKFRPSSEMTRTMEERLMFAIFSVENGNLVGQAKVDHIGIRMESIYGGTWSVWSYKIGTRSSIWYRPPNYAAFDYDGKLWLVYKNAQE